MTRKEQRAAARHMLQHKEQEIHTAYILSLVIGRNSNSINSHANFTETFVDNLAHQIFGLMHGDVLKSKKDFVKLANKIKILGQGEKLLMHIAEILKEFSITPALAYVKMLTFAAQHLSEDDFSKSLQTGTERFQKQLVDEVGTLYNQGQLAYN